MKTQRTKKHLAAALMLAGIVTTAISSPVSPWDGVETEQEIDRYWTYNFNDGQSAQPTIESEYHTDWADWDPGNPTFTYSGTGDAISIQNGQLGFHNASQASTANILIDVPNGYDAANIKYFWFAFDYTGNAPGLDFGTDDTRSDLVPGSLTYTENTGSHIEGYVNFLPQPDSEWINITLTAEAGGSTWIDNLAVGSHCEVIPEPASASLLLLLYPLMILRRNICSDKKRGTSKLYIEINKLFKLLYTV